MRIYIRILYQFGTDGLLRSVSIAQIPTESGSKQSSVDNIGAWKLPWNLKITSLNSYLLNGMLLQVRSSLSTMDLEVSNLGFAWPRCLETVPKELPQRVYWWWIPRENLHTKTQKTVNPINYPFLQILDATVDTEKQHKHVAPELVTPDSCPWWPLLLHLPTQKSSPKNARFR